MRKLWAWIALDLALHCVCWHTWSCLNLNRFLWVWDHIGFTIREEALHSRLRHLNCRFKSCFWPLAAGGLRAKPICVFAMSAVTNYYKLGGDTQQKLVLFQFWKPKSQIKELAVLCFLQRPWKRSSCISSSTWWLQAYLSLWLHDFTLCLYLCMASSSSVFLK